MKFQWVTPKILEIRFKESYKLCDVTYRFSHYYEDPVFKLQVASRQRLDKYYKEKHKDPKYWKKRWAGSNLPDWALQPFITGQMGYLTKKEQKVIDAVKNKTLPFYVIMTSESAIYARDHELAHALYYTDTAYRHKVTELIKENMPKLQLAIARLNEVGYHGDVLIDELHTYCGVFYHHYLQKLGIPVPSVLTEQLMRLFQEHFDAATGR